MINELLPMHQCLNDLKSKVMLGRAYSGLDLVMSTKKTDISLYKSKFYTKLKKGNPLHRACT